MTDELPQQIVHAINIQLHHAFRIDSGRVASGVMLDDVAGSLEDLLDVQIECVE